MKGRLCCLVLTLVVVRWVSATSRPLAPNDGHGLGFNQPGTGQSPTSLPSTMDQKLIPKQVFKSKEVGAELSEEAYAKGISKIGSSPPSCEHKCYGCIPCEAIQVPTTRRQRSHVGVQYTNYEPEGWKCKCGPSFYSP